MDIKTATIGGYESASRQLMAVCAGDDMVSLNIGSVRRQVVCCGAVDTSQQHPSERTETAPSLTGLWRPKSADGRRAISLTHASREAVTIRQPHNHTNQPLAGYTRPVGHCGRQGDKRSQGPHRSRNGTQTQLVT